MRPLFGMATLVVALTTLMIACDSEGGDAAATPDAAVFDAELRGADGTDAANPDAPRCTATLRWLQKDAYREGAGRNSELWPPHTTMAMQIVCSDETFDAVMANHGTEPDEVDEAGDTILAEIAQASVEGERDTLMGLQAAFEACECGTTFLSMDALEDEAVQSVVGELATYIEANLQCAGAGGTAALVEALRAGDIDSVVAALPDCVWADGRGWDEGFDGALETVISASNESLGDYHVCNNDAALQTELWRGFEMTGEVVACNPDAAACHGPTWLYAP